MATVSEAIGLALPYSAGAPAPYEFRDRFCTAAGRGRDGTAPPQYPPRDIVTREALENAATVVAASGGSTNAALHLPAIAHECGIKFDLFRRGRDLPRTPYIADLKPGGRYVAKDMFEAGGIPILMKTLLDAASCMGECMTVTGRTHRREHGQGRLEPGPGRGAAGERPDHADRRRRRPARQPRPGGRHREGRRDAGRQAELHGPGPLLRR
jgi:dihydroxyacid dehydratase/phosphogluconate dehydratase